MEKMMLMRSLCRSIVRRSHVFSSSPALAAVAANHHIRHLHFPSSALTAPSAKQDCGHPFATRLGGLRSFCEGFSHLPVIKDSLIEIAFKDLMAINWDDLPPSVLDNVDEALSQTTDDKDGLETLKNVFRAAQAVEEFSTMIMQLKMEFDDAIGGSGENVKPLSDEHAKAIKTIFSRYTAYLAAFGPEETYLKKKVEMELGSKLIYLKMRCGGLDAGWGKVSVLGTSGLSGSYIEQR